jgi:hypothetical protein
LLSTSVPSTSNRTALVLVFTVHQRCNLLARTLETRNPEPGT